MEKRSKIGGSKLRVRGSAAGISNSTAAYPDGAPLDRVQYLEAKLILKPDRFKSVESFREFGKMVKKVAKRMELGFIKDQGAGAGPEIREIIFLDTPDFALYQNAFILRRRISYVNGFAQGDPEIVFKFRHPEDSRRPR